MTFRGQAGMVNALDKLSALADLRCSGNPLFGSYSEPSVAQSYHGRRNLRILDGSAIRGS